MKSLMSDDSSDDYDHDLPKMHSTSKPSTSGIIKEAPQFDNVVTLTDYENEH